MAWVQRIQPPGDGRCAAMGHDPAGCTVIDGLTTEPVLHHQTGAVIHQAGTVVWHSHMDAGLHPEHRLNPDHPSEDHRGDGPVPVTQTPWCDACREYAVAKGLHL
jgi:hypothetical protein